MSQLNKKRPAPVITTTTSTMSNGTTETYKKLQQNFSQGNTWLVCQNNDVVLKGYDGPLMPGMYVMFQSKSEVTVPRTPVGGNGDASKPRNMVTSLGIDRRVMKVEKIDADSGDVAGEIVLCSEIACEEADAVADEEEERVSIKVAGKLTRDALQLDYPPHNRGVMQCYTRVADDASYEHNVLKGRGASEGAAVADS